jgi:hypothetical protein
MSLKAPGGFPPNIPAELPKVRSGVGAPVSFEPQALPAETSEGKPKVIAGQFKLAPASDIFLGDDAKDELAFAFRALGGDAGHEPTLPKFDPITGMAVIAALGTTRDDRIAAVERGIKAVNSEAVVRPLQRDEAKNAAIGEHHDPVFAEVIAGGRRLRFAITGTGFERFTEAAPAGVPELPKKKQ